MKSKNSGKTDPYRLLLNLSEKINLNKVINMFLYIYIYYTWKNIKDIKQ